MKQMMKVKLPVPALSLLSFEILMSCHSKSAGSGFVEVRELDGAWWFISPEGEPFFSMGVNHAITPPMWLGSYNRDNTAKMFGKGMLNAKGDWWQEGNEQASEAEIKWLRHISELTIAALPRNGLVDPFGKPYETFTRMVTEANKRAQAWHEGSTDP